MRGKIITGFFLLIAVMPLVLGATTEIKVLAYPIHEVQVNILSVETSDLITILYANSSESGEAIMSYTGGPSSFNIHVIVRKNGKIIKTAHEDRKISGNPILIDLLNDKVEVPVENKTSAENLTETNVTANANELPAEKENETILSGNVVVESSGNESNGFFSNITKLFFNKTAGYIVLGIFLALIVVFFVFRFGGSMVNRIPKNEEIKVVKLSERSAENDRNSLIEQQLAEAQERLKQAQREINQIKNQNKIREIEARIEEERKMIEQLKNGEL